MYRQSLILDFDIPSEAELFYRNWKGKELKNIWVEFATFESNSIDMSILTCVGEKFA